MKDFLHHLFIPHESNNHRSKLLHHKSLILIILFLLCGQLFLTAIKTNLPSILGISVDVSAQELLLLVNQKRQEQGLLPLTLNEQLSNAAFAKAKDMYGKNYWSHNSPDGTTPWYFIKNQGYNYTYAGENLARGFTTSKETIDAWMASPTHKENILSENYQDVGFAIMQGKLLGEETVLVVEMFGNTGRPIARQSSEKVNKSLPETNPINLKPAVLSSEKTFPVQNVFSNLKINTIVDSFSLSKDIGIFLLSLFILVFSLDLIIIERKKIARLVGHNIDHIFFLTAILIFVILLSKGIII